MQASLDKVLSNEWDGSNMLESMTQQLDQQSKPVILAIAAGLLVLIGVADWWTGPAMSLAMFYLLPIAVAAWFAGRHAGVAFSVASALTWLAANGLHAQARAHIAVLGWNATAWFVSYCVTAILLANTRRVQQSGEQASKSDFLTGAINRRGFYELAEAERLRCTRYRRPLTLAYIDIDDFKEVNDGYGHDVGDALLVEVVEKIRGNLRRTDSVARLGGDEFAILLPEADGDAAYAALSKLNNVLRRTIESVAGAVSFSIGVVTFSVIPASTDQMLKEADKVMYSVKKRGKNNIAFARIGPGLSPGAPGSNTTPGRQ